jgi:uncharacterized protein (DUF2062 family)
LRRGVDVDDNEVFNRVTRHSCPPGSKADAVAVGLVAAAWLPSLGLVILGGSSLMPAGGSWGS